MSSKSIDTITIPLVRRRWKPFTVFLSWRIADDQISFRWVKSATLAHRQCTLINSSVFNTSPRRMAGPNSSACRTTITFVTVRKNVKCSPHARKQESGIFSIIYIWGSIIPWSPIARGLLAKPLGGSSLRSETDGFLKLLFSNEMKESEKEIVNRVEALAKKRGVSMAQIATAWVLSNDGISCESIANDSGHGSNCRSQFGGENQGNGWSGQLGVDGWRKERAWGALRPKAHCRSLLSKYISIALVIHDWIHI